MKFLYGCVTSYFISQCIFFTEYGGRNRYEEKECRVVMSFRELEKFYNKIQLEMEKIIRIILLSIVCCTLENATVSSQIDSTFDVERGYYLKYFKDKLLVGLKQHLISNSNYMNDVNAFIINNGGVIDSLYHLGNYIGAEVSLIGTNSNAINFIQMYIESQLFESVTLNYLVEPVDFFIYPNQLHSSTQTLHRSLTSP
ncbi:MAG: hypothetical protein IPG02_08755 [Ignavibacteria bacterium]|nr:hypothetical protein [Ignavibacteria bacterium]